MSFLKHAPRFRIEEAINIAKDRYGIHAIASPLPSERDQNFLLTLDPGEKFVLKIANAMEQQALLDAQNRVLIHLAQHVSFCPHVVPTISGSFITEAQSTTGSGHYVRLVSYIPGIPLGRVRRHSPELLRDFGRCVGQLDRALQGFDHPAFHRDLDWDFQQSLRVIQKYMFLITDADLQKLVEQISANFMRDIAPLLPRLRQSVIHNDANDFNVIVGGGNDWRSRNQSVVGIVDFGDMVYSYTIGDLAIAIAYAILNKPDPLAAASQVVKGYHSEKPLTDLEIQVLFGLVCMRLCVSVCMAAFQQKQQPENAYLSISQKAIQKTLPKLARIHPRFAEALFRHAYGVDPVPSSQPVLDWLQKSDQNFSSVIGVDMAKTPAIIFDLGIGSPLVHGDMDENSEPAMTERLFNLMQLANVRLGVGRYDEPRYLYNTPAFATGAGMTDERRTVHLGIDLFAKAATPIFAPLPGTLHAFANNPAPLDYGNVIILEHRTDRGIKFYTLYGHLSKSSLNGLYIGKPVKQGDQIATLGTPEENGGWTPHLHFQIILDLLDLDCDFPGVCQPSQREVWTRFSPDPNMILRIPENRFPAEDKNKSETLAIRQKYVGANLSIGYHDPVKIARGWMQYFYDETGRKYLDAYNNVPHVGHCHPRVVKAGQEQMAVLNTNTRYLHDFLNRYAERLAATLPDPLKVCYFVNSASEANELALRLARAHTRQRDMIVLEGSYHGHTTTLIDISPYKHDGPGGSGAPSWVHTAPLADIYRGLYKRNDPAAGAKYARHVLEIVERLHQKGIGLAGFIAESCPSVGGQIIFPDGYLAAVYQHVRHAGGVCIADEVQTGYGRIGTHFYAFEAQGVVPDIVVLGKPIGNGHPIAAIITTPEIAAAFDNGMEFFSTFGGNTVSCAIGLAVLDVVLEEKLQDHALKVGNYLIERIRPLKKRFPIIGDVRGSGLFIGIELVRNHDTLEPAEEEASFICNRMREHGVLLGTDGPFHNVIKIRPPMPFTENDADFLVEILVKILTEDFDINRT